MIERGFWDTSGIRIDRNNDKTYSNVSVFSRGCQSSSRVAVWGWILSEEAGSSDVGNHLRERASADANHRITFYVRIKTNTALAFAFLLGYYSQSPDIGKLLNFINIKQTYEINYEIVKTEKFLQFYVCIVWIRELFCVFNCVLQTY